MIPTIFALASGGGRAALSVYRLSGADAGRALQALTGQDLPAPRMAALRILRDSQGKEIDKGLDRKSTRLNSSHVLRSRMPSSA